jgi:ABC-type multidrug transport system permease subunit
MSLILAFGWRVVYVALLPLTWGLFLSPLGYVVGLILGISGKGEVQASDRLGRILATVAIMFNAINLAWSVLGTGMALRALG